MVFRDTRICLLAAAVCMAATSASAKEETESTTGFKPSVEVKQKYTDNVYRESKNEHHSWITTVKPGAEMVMKKGVQTFTLGANTEAGYYTIDSRNDYVDWAGYAKAELEMDPRNHLDLGARRKHSHDTIGTGASEGRSGATIQDEPDEYTQTDGDIKYTFGAKKARGKLVLRDIYMDKEYTNNRESTQKLDRTDNDVRATAYLRVMPKTTLLLEAREKSINYVKPYRQGYVMDSDESSQYIGVEWEATAKTTGSVRVGHTEKDFVEKHGYQASPHDDYDAPSWETSVTWKPVSYSSFTADLNRGPTEASTGVTYIDRTDAKLSWNHEWSSYLKSKMFLRRYTDDYVSTPRNDDVESLGMGLTYALNKWVDLSADYVYEDKNSTIDSFDYNGSMIVFGAKMAVD